MPQPDYNNCVAITQDIFWVGFYDAEADLHCNPYLLIDEQDVVIFDPGSIPHFPVVMRKVIDVVKPSQITLIVASHQDPDVCGNLTVVEDVVGHTDLQIAAHSKAIRLIRHIGTKSPFYPVDENNFSFQLKSGRVLDFIATPFLHSPGSIMAYDRQTKSLFSSDLFGAVDKDWTLHATGPGYFEQMAVFHELYMPTNTILRRCMESLETLVIERILPQHGSVLEGELVPKAIAFLKKLSCGYDLHEGLEQ